MSVAETGIASVKNQDLDVVLHDANRVIRLPNKIHDLAKIALFEALETKDTHIIQLALSELISTGLESNMALRDAVRLTADLGKS
jgi:transcription termination factor NusB